MFSNLQIFALEETFLIKQGIHARVPISDMQVKIRNKQVFL